MGATQGFYNECSGWVGEPLSCVINEASGWVILSTFSLGRDYHSMEGTIIQGDEQPFKRWKSHQPPTHCVHYKTIGMHPPTLLHSPHQVGFTRRLLLYITQRVHSPSHPPTSFITHAVAFTHPFTSFISQQSDSPTHRLHSAHKK